MDYIKYLDMFRAILCSSSGDQNCIFTASGIVTLCERPCSAQVYLYPGFLRYNLTSFYHLRLGLPVRLAFYGRDRSLFCPQQPVTALFSQPVESTPYM
jgi:hypothetical protein